MVENGQVRYVTDNEACSLLRDFGTSEREAATIIGEGRPWSLTNPLLSLELSMIGAIAPTCPSCSSVGVVGARMQPIVRASENGNGGGRELVFICKRCNVTMKDRRRSPRR